MHTVVIITLRIDPEIKACLKAQSAATGISINQLANTALAAGLGIRKEELVAHGADSGK